MWKIGSQAFIKMFRPKRKTNGAMWASILGIGIGAATVYGVTRGKGKEIALPFQKALKNFPSNFNLNSMNDTALTEFSQELLESSLKKKN